MKKNYLIGFDIGSSSVKVAIIDSETGEQVSSAFSPDTEMRIESSQIGWAEQHPDEWWKHLVIAARLAISKLPTSEYEFSGIGISYQMHGLVMLDKHKNVLYPSIIWCDSRAVEIGDNAFNELGKDYCLENYLNSPGNFTASKLKWVQVNLPEVYEKIYKIMLPGDYIVFKLTGEINTTISGLSEGILWDFKKNQVATELLDHYKINSAFIPDVVPTFSIQGKLTSKAAEELNMKPGVPIGYRAGDQPNNAFSLNVLNPGEIATTAGTSGVVYGLVNQNSFDKYSRVNSFAHVNYSIETPIKGVLLCINGTGILYNWIKNVLMKSKDSYDKLNSEAMQIDVGADGVSILPFGNGAERVLKNINIGSHIMGINFNNHSRAHILRASQEGIAFSFKYGIDIMKDMGIKVNLMRAGKANMFLSSLFTEAIANTTEATVELYSANGSQGAARGAGVGSKIYNSFDEAFIGFKKLDTIEPKNELVKRYTEAYENWKNKLKLFFEQY